MKAPQAGQLLYLDRETTDRLHLRVRLDGLARHDQFVDYLRKLGCTVSTCGRGIFDVSVTYPDTVEDEASAVAEWCAIWSAAHAPAARAFIT